MDIDAPIPAAAEASAMVVTLPEPPPDEPPKDPPAGVNLRLYNRKTAQCIMCGSDVVTAPSCPKEKVFCKACIWSQNTSSLPEHEEAKAAREEKANADPEYVKWYREEQAKKMNSIFTDLYKEEDE